MTTTELQNTEIPRNHWGQPLIVPPKGGKRVGYRRTTTFADVLENQKGLEAWSMRCVAYGISQRPDLVLGAAALDPNLALSGEHPQKKKLNAFAEQAKEFARSSAAATTGTALHALTEQLDRGQKLGHVPDPYGADLEAYKHATAGIEWLGIEAFRVHDEWKIAGTADRIGRNPNGRLQIYDIKTGSIDYPHKMAMQLAMYAHSLPYDIPTDKRGDPEDGLDLSTGVIIHLPAGKGICDLYEINIGKGWGACLIAKQVWQWRGEKDLTHKVGDDRISTWEKASGPAPFGPAAWLQMIQLADTLDRLRDIWQQAKAGGHLTEDFRAAAQKRSQELST